MKTRPRLLTLYALGAIGVAVSLPLQVLVMFEMSLPDLNLALGKLTWLNYAMGLSLLGLATFAWIGSNRLLLMATFTFLVVAANNYFVGLSQVNYSSNQAFLGTIVFAIFAYVPYLVPSIRRVLMNPKLRWWNTPTRISFKAPVLVMSSEENPIGEVLAYDISKSGMFIQSPIGDYYGLKVGDRIAVRWMNQFHQKIERDAVVIRTAEPSGNYPQGLGLRFDVTVSSAGF